MTSLNELSAYFVDSLMGTAESTKHAYDNDIQQFKLYLVLYRTRLIVGGDPQTIADLKVQLEKSGGHLTDTRYLRRQYKTEVRTQHLLDRLDIDLSKLRKEDIVGYFGYLESTKGLARSTLVRRLSSLRRFFKMLTKEKYDIDPDAVERLMDLNIKPDKKMPIALKRDEALAFLSVIENIRDRTLIIVMLYMGLRISEVVSLNADDITDQSEGVVIRGKGNKERYIPVHPIVREAIAAYKLHRPDVPADADGTPLFVSQWLKRIDASTVRKMIKKYAAQAELLDNQKRQQLSPHKLRHTFATMLLQGDVDIRYIQELLGHENLSTTQIYTSVNQSDLHVAIDRHPLSDLSE